MPKVARNQQRAPRNRTRSEIRSIERLTSEGLRIEILSKKHKKKIWALKTLSQPGAKEFFKGINNNESTLAGVNKHGVYSLLFIHSHTSLLANSSKWPT